jgi:hypothetical protein
VAISSINPENGTAITGCDALFIENQWFEYTTSNKHEPATVSFASPLEWFQAMWLVNFDGIAREVDGAELEIMSRNNNAGRKQEENPFHIGNFMSRVAGVMNSIRPLADFGIAIGSDLLGKKMGNPDLGAAAAQIASGILNGVGSFAKGKRK